MPPSAVPMIGGRGRPHTSYVALAFQSHRSVPVPGVEPGHSPSSAGRSPTRA
jgi:hypothetical protein